MVETDLQKAVRYLQQYLDSSSWDGWTVEDLMKHYTVYPIIVDEKFIGLFGCYMCELENQKICSIAFLYTDPVSRNGHIKKVFRSVAQTLEQLQVTGIFIHTDERFKGVFDGFLHKRPDSFVYQFDMTEFHDKVAKWERGHA